MRSASFLRWRLSIVWGRSSQARPASVSNLFVIIHQDEYSKWWPLSHILNMLRTWFHACLSWSMLLCCSHSINISLGRGLFCTNKQSWNLSQYVKWVDQNRSRILFEKLLGPQVLGSPRNKWHIMSLKYLISSPLVILKASILNKIEYKKLDQKTQRLHIHK